MKKNTFLYILLFFLIVVNGFFLFNYIGVHNFNEPDESQREKNFIVKELGFNDRQLEEFNNKSKGHHETMTRFSEEVRVLKDQLFSTLTDDNVQVATVDSISALICDIETLKEKEVFYHFKMIQDIANDEQKEKFKSILKDALRRGDNENRPPPPSEAEGHRPPPPGDAEGHRPPPR